MIVLDTTVLAYAVGAEHTFRGPCRRLVTAIETGAVLATTTPEVIQEFAHIRARRRTRTDATELAAAFADLLSPLMVVEEATLRAGLRLFESHPRLGAVDAVLCAAVLEVGAVAIASADAAFAEVAGLQHVVPDESGVAGLLDGSIR